MAFISRTDDPIADFNRHEDEEEKRLSHLPRCSCCQERIQQDTVVRFNGKYICDDCMDVYYREPIYDFD